MKSGEKALTRGEVGKLLSVMTNLRDLALIKLAIGGGIRRGDIIRIMIQDIDLKEGSVSFKEEKKDDAIHKVYLPSDVMNTLAMLICTNLKRNGFLFTTNYGDCKHISGVTAWNILNRNLIKAGLSPIPFHALRATCVKLCQARGWTPSQTAKHINDTLRVVEAHYSVPSQDEMKETAKEKAIL
jgi:integrase